MHGDIQKINIMDSNGKKIVPLLIDNFGDLHKFLLKLYLAKKMKVPFTVHGEWGKNYPINYGEPFTMVYDRDEMDDLRVFGRIL